MENNRESRRKGTERVVNMLNEFFGNVPGTAELQATNPFTRSQAIARGAARKAAAVSGALAIPAGPLGLFTILPDLLAIWRIQSQMVADIAGSFGKTPHLSREQMIYCLFRHAASQAVRDLVIRVGQRYIIRRASLELIERVLQKVGIRVTQRVAGRFISRWLPIIGAVGVGAYAYYDTARVARTAMELFQEEIVEEPAADISAQSPALVN